jgi:hypothetical protein
VQQKLSTQKPVEQSLFCVQALPGVTLQVPVVSQDLPLVQESGSGPLVTATHDPSGAVQAWQGEQLAVPQQWPSTQWPLMHSPLLPQLVPGPYFVWHANAELQN